MKYIRVGLNKLKISLSDREAKRYNIRPHDESFDKRELKETVFGLLAGAEKECGYTLGNDKAIIQIYPSDNHGAEILITKLSTLPKNDQQTVCESENISTIESVDRVFCFKSREELMRAATAMRGKKVECDIYLSNDGYYYAAIREQVFGGISQHIALYEFGEELPEIPYDVISERGTVIASKCGFESLSDVD